MYAQMCKLLVDRAPNFDPPEASACTFKRLLLNKCRVEFENRVQIAQQYEKYASDRYVDLLVQNFTTKWQFDESQ